MQDIDFSRYYRRQRRPNSAPEVSESRGRSFQVNKLSLYLAIAFSSLAIGFIGGTQLQKSKMTREIEGKVVPDSIATANVSHPATANDEEKVSENVRLTRPDEKIQTDSASKEGKGSYLILAKIFPDEKEASLAGLNLKRNGQKAFMARNGKKVKLYVGPIEGKAEAYEALAKLKKNSDFSGAILYRK
ncbi:MAG: SPOR domain-containing protein [Turneriella sp.]|nr:SPOR domain-containing protein [Turneriella sp.]